MQLITNIRDLKPHHYYYGKLNNGQFFKDKLLAKKNVTTLIFKSFTCNYLDIAEIRRINFLDYVF
ncbi:hypothetical protein WEU38_10960 [Cyanobacterium aponinum AL20118]|uniref:Uncharacterized protein n=2 Tax=Cyanobacterium aponinum TaxID=379064 RepID=A0A844GR47_9CHRO|nr:hypothetical protein [Cyanobacterium aponinum]MTF37551.1 hypothetical protein [Cyanobacterium aponinum 0216]PHV63718.1 hypothetical protein CSQ80_03870 [Cyanobacterium aponinum IPPAS B-1201]WPF87331.1 hypothetical protein SAY89_10990 [Cyanobacterium aponinum AL20115]